MGRSKYNSGIYEEEYRRRKLASANAMLNVSASTRNSIGMREGRSQNERVLAIADRDLASIWMPGCPDIEPYEIVVAQVDDRIEPKGLNDWLLEYLPAGKYLIKHTSPPDTSAERIYLGNTDVETGGRMAVLLDDDPYYGVGVIADESNFAGAVFLAVCVPDYLLARTSKRGVFFVQIASTTAIDCHLIVPAHEGFCLCLHDTFSNGEEESEKLRKWYRQTGAGEIIKIVDGLTDSADSYI